MEIMTPQHPKWNEFYARLQGPEGCDFRKDPKRKWVWKCKGGEDKSYTKKILKNMRNIDVSKSLQFFEKEGAFCDCEILFNLEID